MRIADLPESTTYDESCYMPLDLDGATYKTKVENITPNIANDVQTTSEGYVWAARQGKLLKDRIDENTDGIAESDGVITEGIVVDTTPWTLYGCIILFTNRKRDTYICSIAVILQHGIQCCIYTRLFH